MNMVVILPMQLKTKTSFNLHPSAPRLKISSIVKTETTSPQDKLEIKHENDQYKIGYKAELQLHLKQKIIMTQTWEKHMHSYLDNAQQA